MSNAPTPALKTSAFKIPGEGSSAFITTVTIVVKAIAWFVVTNMGWIKPIFLPSPQATYQQFYEYLTGIANDKPLWQHFIASMLRVFAAFLLACATAIPVGIAMGMSRFWRGIFDPPIELLRPLPPLASLLESLCHTLRQSVLWWNRQEDCPKRIQATEHP